MNHDTANLILWIQLVLPVVIAVPLMLFAKPSFNKEARKRVRRAAEPRGSAIVPWHCRACGAPVPLTAGVAPCPSCYAPVEPPHDYQRTFALRAHAVAELTKAERRWRWSRWTSSALATWLIRALFVGWFGLVAFSALTVADDWATQWLLFAAAYAIIQVGGVWSGTASYAAARKTLPAVPQFMKLASSVGVCADCGAPVHFGEGAFSTLCGYCGGDNYREVLVRAARADATEQATAARASVLEASRAIDERLDDLMMLSVFVGIIAIGLSGLLLIFNAWDRLWS